MAIAASSNPCKELFTRTEYSTVSFHSCILSAQHETCISEIRNLRHHNRWVREVSFLTTYSLCNLSTLPKNQEQYPTIIQAETGHARNVPYSLAVGIRKNMAAQWGEEMQ